VKRSSHETPLLSQKIMIFVCLFSSL